MRRLSLVRRVRPLGLSLEDVRSLLDTLERLPDPGDAGSGTDEQAHEELVERLRTYWQEADARCEELRRELAEAEEFARSLHGHLARLAKLSPTTAREGR